MKRSVVITKPPVLSGKNSIPDGAICGNGDIGVVLGSSECGLRVYIAKNDLWLAQEDGSKPGGIKPYGFVDFDVPKKLYDNYYVRQEIGTGEIICDFKEAGEYVNIKIFASAVSNTVLFEIQSNLTDTCVPVLQPFTKYSEITELNCTDGSYGFIKSMTGENLKFNTACAGVFKRVSDSKYALFLCTNHDSEDYADSVLKRAADFTVADFDYEYSAHLSWWNEFWQKSDMKIADELLEQNWYLSQYFLAVSARNMTFPPGIYGNFITGEDVNWKGDYHLNYNYQAPFYHLCSSNHVELTDCYFAPLEDYMPQGQKNARDFLGVEGIYYPTGIGPKGMATELCGGKFYAERPFLGQKSNAAHAADIMVFRWYSTRDVAFAKEHIYPYLKQVALFFETYLTKENGKYCITNDSIHETPYYKADFSEKKYKKQIHEKNNLLSLGLIRMVLKCIIDISREIHVDEQKIPVWQDILDNLSDYSTYYRNFKKVFRYTLNGMRWSKTNFLCLQHCYPASQIGLGSDPKLLKIARNTFFSTKRWFDGNAANSIFPCAARLGIDPKLIISKYKDHCSRFQLPNGLMYHGGGCLENCSLGAAVINEMVLQSYEGIIRIFPVWDKNIDCEYNNLRADGAFLVSSKLENGKIKRVIIKSEKGREFKLLNPFDKCSIESGGKTVLSTDEIITLKPEIGETVIIRPCIS